MAKCDPGLSLSPATKATKDREGAAVLYLQGWIDHGPQKSPGHGFQSTDLQCVFQVFESLEPTHVLE